MVFAEANSCFESYHLSGISRDMGLHEASMLPKTPMNQNDIFCTNANADKILQKLPFGAEVIPPLASRTRSLAAPAGGVRYRGVV